jgi:hypothetical protein
MTALAALLFSGATLVWLVYWLVVRPVLMASVENDLRKLKAELDWAIIEGYPGSSSQAAEVLLVSLQNLKVFRFLSLSQFFHMAFFHWSKINAESLKKQQVFSKAADWIKGIYDRRQRLSQKAMLINSPAWWLPMAILLLLAVFSLNLASKLKVIEEATIEADNQFC